MGAFLNPGLELPSTRSHGCSNTHTCNTNKAKKPQKQHFFCILCNKKRFKTNQHNIKTKVLRSPSSNKGFGMCGEPDVVLVFEKDINDSLDLGIRFVGRIVVGVISIILAALGE